MKMITGEHIYDKSILYIRDHFFKVECLDENFPIMETTVDGEMGPNMPFTVQVIPQAIPVFGRFDAKPKSEDKLKALLKNATQTKL